MRGLPAKVAMRMETSEVWAYDNAGNMVSANDRGGVRPLYIRRIKQVGSVR